MKFRSFESWDIFDHEFKTLRDEISERSKILDKSIRIKIAAWAKKLSEEGSGNVVWKKNRNLYAKLLLLQIKSGRIYEEPFNTLPPQGPLPNLDSKYSSCIRGATSLNRSNSKGSGYSYGGSSMNHITHNNNNGPTSAPSQQLDSYIIAHSRLLNESLPPDIHAISDDYLDSAVLNLNLRLDKTDQIVQRHDQLLKQLSGAVNSKDAVTEDNAWRRKLRSFDDATEALRNKIECMTNTYSNTHISSEFSTPSNCFSLSSSFSNHKGAMGRQRHNVHHEDPRHSTNNKSSNTGSGISVRSCNVPRPTMKSLAMAARNSTSKATDTYFTGFKNSSKAKKQTNTISVNQNVSGLGQPTGSSTPSSMATLVLDLAELRSRLAAQVQPENC